MPIRDFRQIRPVDFGQAAAITGQAASQFGQGFAGLSKLVEAQQAQQKQHFAAETDLNTQKLLSGMESIGSLGELKQAEKEGAFSTDTLRRQFGVQYDPTAVKGMVDTTKERLMGDALAKASAVGEQAATAGGDVSLGSRAVYESLTAQGVDADEALTHSSNWKQGAGVLQDEFTRIKKANQQDFLSKMGDVRVQSNTHINQLVAQAKEATKDSGGIDEASLRATLTNQLKGMKEDVQFSAVKQAALDKQMVNKGLTAMSSALKAGTDPSKAITQGSKGLQGEALIKYQRQAKDYASIQSELSASQKDAFTHQMNVGTKEIERVKSSGLGKIKTMQATLNKRPPAITTEVQDHFADQADPGGHIIDWFENEINSRLTDGVVSGALGLFDKVTTGDAAMKLVNEKFSNLTAGGKYSDQEAAALMLQSWKSTLQDQKALAVGKGINSVAWDAEIDRRGKSMGIEKQQKAAIAEESLKLEQRLNQMDTDLENRMYSFKRGERAKNLTGRAAERLEQEARKIAPKAVTTTKDLTSSLLGRSGVKVPTGQITKPVVAKPVPKPQPMPKAANAIERKKFEQDVASLAHEEIKSGGFTSVVDENTIGDWVKNLASKTQPAGTTHFGEDEVSAELRRLDIATKLGDRKAIARKLRKMYPKMSTKEVITMLRNGAFPKTK